MPDKGDRVYSSTGDEPEGSRGHEGLPVKPEGDGAVPRQVLRRQLIPTLHILGARPRGNDCKTSEAEAWTVIHDLRRRPAGTAPLIDVTAQARVGPLLRWDDLWGAAALRRTPRPAVAGRGFKTHGSGAEVSRSRAERLGRGSPVR
jgi:hypothetical protein